MAHLGPILMGNEAKVLNFPASGGALSGASSQSGGGRCASFRAFAPQLRCPRRLASLADILRQIGCADLRHIYIYIYLQYIIKCYRYTFPLCSQSLVSFLFSFFLFFYSFFCYKLYGVLACMCFALACTAVVIAWPNRLAAFKMCMPVS